MSTLKTFTVTDDADRVFRVEWDPRETSVTLMVSLKTWTEPPGVTIAEEEKPEILSRLFGQARSYGVGHVVEKVNGHWVVRRWNRGDDGFLVNVESHELVLYCEIDKTLAVPFERIPGFNAKNKRIGILAMNDARWVYPPTPDGAATPLDPAERPRIESRLVEATEDDMFDSELAWRFVASAPPPDSAGKNADPSE
jgi:hypothetical protein